MSIGALSRDRAGGHRKPLLAVNAIKGSIAVLFIARPAELSAWVGPTAGDPGGAVLLRAFGIRDLSLALGAINARSAPERKRWLLAGGASDLFDALTTVALARTHRDRLGPLVGLTAAWAAASGAACIALALAQPAA